MVIYYLIILIIKCLVGFVVSDLHFAIYVSKGDFDSDALEELLSIAQEKNKRKNISGYLYYENGFFLQYIESFDQKELQILLDTLKLDKRHKIIQSFTNKGIMQRRFTDWDMRWISREQLLKLNLENEMIEYIKWLSNDAELVKFNSPRVWSLVDTLSVHKKQLDSLLEKH